MDVTFDGIYFEETGDLNEKFNELDFFDSCLTEQGCVFQPSLTSDNGQDMCNM